MSIKKFLAAIVCALLLTAATVSAQETAETNPWTSSLQTTTLEGFGARLTIALPPPASSVNIYSHGTTILHG